MGRGVNMGIRESTKAMSLNLTENLKARFSFPGHPDRHAPTPNGSWAAAVVCHAPACQQRLNGSYTWAGGSSGAGALNKCASDGLGPAQSTNKYQGSERRVG